MNTTHAALPTPANAPFKGTAKWGHALGAGYQPVPDVLLKYQVQLGLKATDLVVLMNLTMHWWYPDQRPFPSAALIARRTGIAVRTVRRSIAVLKKKKLVAKVGQSSAKGTAPFVYDLTGLVTKLTKFSVNDPAYRERRVIVEDKAMVARISHDLRNEL